ncbi:MAG: hypothetical protein HKP37_04330 [Boseongicola sp.]|nr:hypothetical protein [Boseongicola sp.]
MSNAPLGNAIVALFDHSVLLIVRLCVLFRLPKVTARYLCLSDQKFLPNPALPKSLNDKFFWRKVFDKNPLFPIVCDKLAVRDWLKENGFDLVLPEVVWVGNDAGDIPEDLWQPGLVLKGNNGSGWNVFFKEPMPKRDDVIARARHFATQKYGTQWYEPFYFEVQPKIYLEEFIEQAKYELKFYTFGDIVPRVFAPYERDLTQQADIWRTDEDGLLYVSDEVSPSSKSRANRPLPPVAAQALAIAKALGQRFDHVRVDFLSDGHELWFSELTLTNLGGHVDGVRGETYAQMNAAWDLRKSWFLTTPQAGWRRIYASALLRRLNARSA